MILPEENLNLWLGRGGERPGVGRLTRGATAVIPVLDLPGGHSVYALDVNEQGTTLAAGTRAGAIHRYAGEKLLSLPQGAPVLAVCLLADGRLASADTLGRCLLWQPGENPPPPTALTHDGECVGSLVALPDGYLWGVAAAGRLLAWDDTCQLVQSRECPHPAGKLALVRLQHWPERPILTYPACAGQFVLCFIEENRIQVVDAHEGDCYAACFIDDELCTIGWGDNRLRTWDSCGKLRRQWVAPPEIIAAEAGLDDAEIVLITANGRAGIYEFTADALQEKAALSGQDYRTVRGPSAEGGRVRREERRQARGHELCRQIQERIRTGDQAGEEGLHQELIRLDFAPISLALRAQGARQRQEGLAELRARHALAGILPDHRAEAAQSLDRYAQVLEEHWLLPEAQTICERAHGLDHHQPAPSTWLVQSALAMRGDGWIAKAEPLLANLVTAAEVVSKPFQGRWVWDSFNPIPFPAGTLAANDLLHKYEQVRQEDGRAGLPAARLQSVTWLSRELPRPMETLLLAGTRSQLTEYVELAIQVLQDGLQTILAPYLIFNAHLGTAAECPGDHNQQVTTYQSRLEHRESIGPWLKEVQRTLIYVLRRLRTSYGHPQVSK